ncbi:MAG: ribonuclease HII [Bacilli bacterium]
MMKKINDNYQYEKKLYEEGYEYIAGIDEVGRGPLAGPVVACAVIMPKGCYIEGVTDSKKLSHKKRQQLKAEIMEKALAIGISFIDEKIIDEINIYEATKKAMQEALSKLSIKPDYVLIDAMPLELEIPHQAIIKGDELSFMIGCASIIAKEARDDFMIELDQKYPQYGFKQNKGYPTKMHREALKKYGISIVHRKTYGPVKSVINQEHYEQEKLF